MALINGIVVNTGMRIYSSRFHIQNVSVRGGVDESLCQPHQSGGVSSSHRCTAQHRHLLHGLVLCIRSHINKVHSRYLQGVTSVFSSIAIHGIWSPVPSIVGRDIRIGLRFQQN